MQRVAGTTTVHRSRSARGRARGANLAPRGLQGRRARRDPRASPGRKGALDLRVRPDLRVPRACRGSKDRQGPPGLPGSPEPLVPLDHKVRRDRRGNPDPLVRQVRQALPESGEILEPSGRPVLRVPPVRQARQATVESLDLLDRSVNEARRGRSDPSGLSGRRVLRDQQDLWGWLA